MNNIFKKLNSKKPLIFKVAFLLFLSSFCYGQASLEAAYNIAKKAQISDNKDNAVIEIARSFLGKPYIANTLEEDGPERLIVNLNGFDCTTLVEQTIAIANSKDFNSFKKELIKLRYRNGIIDGYGSRLHYLTDWLIENESKTVIKQETKNFGGVLYKKEVNFISKNWVKYPRANSDKIKNEILASEKSIANHKIYFIPKTKIDSIQHLIKNGDIIAITTSIGGLDCSHQGFAIRVNGKLHLLHASSSAKKVIISEEPLANYLKKNKLQTGIMIARIL